MRVLREGTCGRPGCQQKGFKFVVPCTPLWTSDSGHKIIFSFLKWTVKGNQAFFLVKWSVKNSLRSHKMANGREPDLS